MSDKYKVEDVKKEEEGFVSPKQRVTSRDSEGKVGVSDWKPTQAEATQQARERLSEPKKK